MGSDKDRLKYDIERKGETKMTEKIEKGCVRQVPSYPFYDLPPE